MGLMVENYIHDPLKREINWYHAQPLIFDHLCACGTEEMISKSDNPGRMRAFLLVSIFLDQFVYTHYQATFSNFRQHYAIPKLNAHGGAGYASPGWLIYSRHHFDEKADWAAIDRFASKSMIVIRNFLNCSSKGDKERLENLMKLEIEGEFEPIHQSQLVESFLNNTIQSPLIEKLILEYFQVHLPLDDEEIESRHPSNLALSEKIKPELVKKLGGEGGFWAEMVHGAMYWFDPGDDSAEFNIFSGHMSIALGMSKGTDYEGKMTDIQKAFHTWHSSDGGH